MQYRAEMFACIGVILSQIGEDIGLPSMILEMVLPFAFVCGTDDLTPNPSIRFRVTIFPNRRPTISM